MSEETSNEHQNQADQGASQVPPTNLGNPDVNKSPQKHSESDVRTESPSKPKRPWLGGRLSNKLAKLWQATEKSENSNRIVAFATVFIALATAVSTYEIITGSRQTDKLIAYSRTQANAASDQADAAQQFSDTADDIEGSMSDAVNQLQSAADNTRITIQNAEKSFRSEQRAWVGVAGTADVKGFTETEPWKVTVVFFNSGRTPAHNVQSAVRFITSTAPLSGPPPEETKKFIFRPAQSIAPQASYRLSLGNEVGAEITFPSQREGAQTLVSQYSLIKNKQRFLYYFGLVKYDDIFGNHRETEYCILLANPETKEVGICDSFNDLN